MSDNGTAGPLHATPGLGGTAPAGSGDVAGFAEARRPKPICMLVVDVVTGTVTATNPAGRRRLSGPIGLELSRWISGLATTAGTTAPQITVLRTWSLGGEAQVRAECTPVDFRGRRCLLVVLREDPCAEPALDLVPDRTRAVFTLDAVGRIDSWGPTAQRLTGFVADVVIGNETTLLHPGPARLAGDAHRALTDAYRNGEHRAEGWRVCSDGRAIWTDVVTCALHDGLDRLVGFACTMHDLTARRRLGPAAAAAAASGASGASGAAGTAGTAGTAATGWTGATGPTGRVPAPRPPAVAGSVRPTPTHPSLPGPRSPRPGRVPGQRRPSNS